MFRNLSCWFNIIITLIFGNVQILLLYYNKYITYLNKYKDDLQQDDFEISFQNFIRTYFKSIKSIKSIVDIILIFFNIKDNENFNKSVFNFITNSYYYKNNLILSNQLNAYRDKCNNLPFFELFVIDFFKQLDIKVMSAICLPDKKVYYNFHKYYCYENKSNIENYNLLSSKLIADKELKETYKNELNDFIKNYTSNEILVVSHYNHNKQLTEHFTSFNDVLLSTEIDIFKGFTNADQSIINIENNINTIEYKDRKNTSYTLLGCLLRNTNANEKQKTIFGYIDKDEKQHIILNRTNQPNNTKNINIIRKTDIIIDNQFVNKNITFRDDDDFLYKYNFATSDKLLIYIY